MNTPSNQVQLGRTADLVGTFFMAASAVVLGYFLFFYDVEHSGAVSADKLNWRLTWAIVGTGLGLFGALVIVIARLEYLAGLIFAFRRSQG